MSVFCRQRSANGEISSVAFARLGTRFSKPCLNILKIQSSLLRDPVPYDTPLVYLRVTRKLHVSRIHPTPSFASNAANYHLFIISVPLQSWPSRGLRRRKGWNFVGCSRPVGRWSFRVGARACLRYSPASPAFGLMWRPRSGILMTFQRCVTLSSASSLPSAISTWSLLAP